MGRIRNGRCQLKGGLVVSFGNGKVVGADGLGGVRGGVHGHGQVVELLGQTHHLGQLVVLHAQQDPLAGVMAVAGGGEALVDGLVEGPAQAQHLASGPSRELASVIFSKEKTGTFTA